MEINSLPIELLEKIIKSASEGKYKQDLRKYALVCRTWAVIANSLLWGEVDLYSHSHRKEFRMYKHLIMPGTVCGKYIRKLKMDEARLWPICIVKMLRACPNIQELSMASYHYYDKRGDVRDLLSDILRLLPNLRKLDIRFSEDYFDKNDSIEKLIESDKNLRITATRRCKKNNNYIEHYQDGKWLDCCICKTGRYSE